jgi:hypothetical protein
MKQYFYHAGSKHLNISKPFFDNLELLTRVHSTLCSAFINEGVWNTNRTTTSVGLHLVITVLSTSLPLDALMSPLSLVVLDLRVGLVLDLRSDWY